MYNSRLLIIEDVVETMEMIKSFVSTQFPEIEIVGTADSVDGGLELIRRESPDIALFDIQIIGGTTLDILEQLLSEGEISFEVIFITAFGAEYATKALQYSALEFIHKPLDHSEAKVKLESAIHKARRNTDRKLYNEQLKLLIQFFTNSSNEKNNRIALHLLKGIIQFVDLEQIVIIQSDESTSRISLSDGKTLISSKPIAYYNTLLTSDIGFFRISQSIIINTIFIEKFNSSEKYITLTNGEKIVASRRGGKAFKDFIDQSEKLSYLKSKESIISSLLSKIFPNS